MTAPARENTVNPYNCLHSSLICFEAMGLETGHRLRQKGRQCKRRKLNHMGLSPALYLQMCRPYYAVLGILLELHRIPPRAEGGRERTGWGGGGGAARERIAGPRKAAILVSLHSIWQAAADKLPCSSFPRPVGCPIKRRRARLWALPW